MTHKDEQGRTWRFWFRHGTNGDAPEVQAVIEREDGFQFVGRTVKARQDANCVSLARKIAFGRAVAPLDKETRKLLWTALWSRVNPPRAGITHQVWRRA